jgi:hypothetical protein
MDPRKVDAITTTESRRALTLAGKTISCAWTILTVHRKSTDDWSTILIFFDQDNWRFAHAFEIESAEELEVLAERLRRAAATMRTLEKKS